jgi:hypothetical protein
VSPSSKLALMLGVLTVAVSACQGPITDPRRTATCEPAPPPARLVRYLSAQVDDALSPSYGLVLEDEDGIPTRVLNLSAWQSESAAAAPTTLAGPQTHTSNGLRMFPKTRLERSRIGTSSCV